MAEAFVKIKAHTEPDPIYTKANLLLKAVEQNLPKKSPTLYYAAILDQVETTQDNLHHEAALLLLACTLTTTPVALVQKEFSRIKQCVYPIKGDSECIAKYSVKVLERLLGVVSVEDWTVWNESAKLLESFLELLLHSSSYVRSQTATSLIKLLLKGFKDVEAVRNYIANWMHQYIQNFSGKSENMIHVLYFLTGALQLFPIEQTIGISEGILNLATMNYSAIISSQAYLTLETLFAGVALSKEVLEKYLSQILASPPLSGGHERLQISYIQALAQALSHFNSLDSIECSKVLSQGISTLTEYLLSDQYSVQHAAASSVSSVVRRCITSSYAKELNPEDELALSFDVLNIEDTSIRPIQKINATMVYLVNERFGDILEIIFPILSVYIQQLGSGGAHVSQRLIQELDKVSKKYSSSYQFKKLISTAITTLGCYKFFEVLPLKLLETPLEAPDFLGVSRSWVLPILADCQVGDFVFFVKELLPLAQNLEGYEAQAFYQGLTTASKKYQALFTQVWSTFPSICSYHTWNTTSTSLLQQVLPVFSKLISNASLATNYIAKGLKNCITQTTSTVFTNVQDKMLPVVFNTYLHTKAEKELIHLLENYPSTPEYSTKMTKRLIQKVLEATQADKSNEAHLLMDLLVAMVPKLTSVEPSEADILRRFILNYIQSSDNKMQKKAYEVLGGLTKLDLSVGEDFILHKIEICSEAARKERIRFIWQLVQNWSFEKVISSFGFLVPEILHCFRTKSMKTRDLAKKFSVYLGELMVANNAFRGFLNTVLAGLASEISGTKASTVKLTQTLIKNFISPEEYSLETNNYLSEVCLTISYLLKDPNKEVNKACLKFFKGTVPFLHEETCKALAQQLVPGLFSQKSLKTLTKYVLAKLINKLGFNYLEALVPEDHKKLVNYVAKELKKKNKKKTTELTQEDSEEEVNIDKPTPPKPQQAPPLPREYHFLNPMQIPVQPKVKQHTEDHPFPLQDGKFLVQEELGKRSRSKAEPETRSQKKLKAQDGVSITVSGEDYKSSKAKGDMKKDKTPHAFVQFNPQILNKRKQAKVSNKMNKLISTAKQGVLKGLKTRKKNN